MNRSSSISTPAVTPIKPLPATPSANAVTQAGSPANHSGTTMTPRSSSAAEPQSNNPENSSNPHTTNQTRQLDTHTNDCKLKPNTTSTKLSAQSNGKSLGEKPAKSTEPLSKSEIKLETQEFRQGSTAAHSSNSIESPQTLAGNARKAGTSQMSKSSLFSLTQRKDSSAPKTDIDILISDSQESTTQSSNSAANKYKQLLDKIELFTNTTNENDNSIRKAQSCSYSLMDDNDRETISTHNNIPRIADTAATTACEADSSIAWEEDSFMFPSQSSQPNQTVKQSDPGENIASLETKLETKSPDLLEAVLGSQAVKINQRAAENNRPGNEQHGLSDRPAKRLAASPDMLNRFTRLKRARRVRTSTVDTPRSHNRTQSKTDTLISTDSMSHDITSPCFGQSPITSDLAQPSSDTPVVGVDRLRVPSDRRQSASSVWSPLNDSSLLLSAEKSKPESSTGVHGDTGTPQTNATAESNDLFSSKCENAQNVVVIILHFSVIGFACNGFGSVCLLMLFL